MAERTRRRSRSRSPVRRNSDMGIQDRLKKISGIEVEHANENGDKEGKVDREKVILS